jgi:propanol-preferring alcohol dehydrogenase
LPVTPGHEVAGIVEHAGDQVTHVTPGDRVCVHYLETCGSCDFCSNGNEQFCAKVEMIGKHRDGGYAEFIRVSGRNAFRLPNDIPLDVGAVMMCSSATSLHALRKARLTAGESVAIFGFGGLGFSALQIAKALGCGEAYVVDVNPTKLATASAMGGVPIDARAADPVQQIRQATSGQGVDVALELIGSADTMAHTVKCLGTLGRAALVGLTAETLSVLPYSEIINKEAEITGVSDHLASELPLLIEMVRNRKLQFPSGTLRPVGLNAVDINAVLDALEKSTNQIRTVIVPDPA